MITLVKMSERTSRKPCKVCGSKEIYWAKDEATGKFILIDANGDTRSVSKGDTVPLDSVHKCNLNAAPTTAPDADEFDNDVHPVPPARLMDYPYPNDAVLAEIKADRRISAIREYRTQTGFGLVDARDYIEAFSRGRIPRRAVPVKSEPEPLVLKAVETDPVKAALQVIMDAASPKVDTETVRALVKEELQQIVFPTRTVVIREGQEAKPVEGHTHPKLADIITDLLAGEHVFMVGPAGTGKSHLAQQAAEALDRPFYALSVGPQTSKAEIMGYCSATGDYVPNGQFREAYENGGVFLFDEIDAGHPGVLTIMNAALANGHMSFPDKMVKKSDKFLCMASGNTFGRGADRKYQGRQAIDAATLDRFSVETIDYDQSLERDLCMATGLEPSKVNEVLAYVRYLRKAADKHALPVVLGMRASVGMCRLLKAGRSWADAVDARARRGMSDTDWNKISAGAPASA